MFWRFSYPAGRPIGRTMTTRSESQGSDTSITTASIRGILLDIEGTTTPVSFVHEVLFSHAREQLKHYLTQHWDSAEMIADIAILRKEHASDVEAKLNPPALPVENGSAEIRALVSYVNWLMDQDRKSTALKNLQGKIWQRGYLDGTLQAQLFADVAPALRRWHQAGLSINIFSSGSSLAQRLLFAHTVAGDFTDVIENYFDTTSGPKTAVESYRSIAEALRLPSPSILFVSDVVAELDAASEAGMKTLLCVRPGNAPQTHGSRHQVVNSLENVLI